ncbi:Uncharacterized protein FKW44_008509 [Caligus rogercresseyi]|uniref:Reverse transcriptase domain-containing protein n=1 Tax=Caligus rogercresseyi TaxID=217165 RepID=A0A7T8KGB7_CALRO|nr:Uncharacterized protein FKW44_008509 [Caligus rogercresseyi]
MATLATLHAKWLEAEQRGKVVGVLGFDLSAAFDTVNQLQLLPQLGKLGIAGTQFKWFHSYLTGGYQRVVWSGTESEFLPVKYGVRQGSILGPILYLVLVADVTSCVGSATKTIVAVQTTSSSGSLVTLLRESVPFGVKGRRLLQIRGGGAASSLTPPRPSS